MFLLTSFEITTYNSHSTPTFIKFFNDMVFLLGCILFLKKAPNIGLLTLSSACISLFVQPILKPEILPNPFLVS